MSDLIKREEAIEAECSSCAWRDQCEEDSGYWCESGGLIRRDIPSVETKQIKYFDDDEKVWKIGNVIMEQKNEPQAEIPEYAEWKEPFEKMTDCPWK